MKLAIDVTQNQLTIDGQLVRGHHRWEAATLAVLVQGKHISVTSACSAYKLHAALQAFGQARALNRKQLSRLWNGVRRMFSDAGKADAVSSRFGHATRGLTVGPWWWSVQVRDRIRVTAPAARPSGRLNLPRLAVDATPEACAALLQHVMLCDGLLLEGRVDEAAQAFGDSSAWQTASNELQAYRQLRLSECHLQRRDFARAMTALQACRVLVDDCQVAAVYLGAAVQLAAHRLAYVKSPATNYSKIAGAIAPLLNPGARGPEVDRHTRGLALNLAALCERRWLEEHAAGRGGEASMAHFHAALRYWCAALFAFVTSNQHEHAQNMCSNIGYLLHRAFELGLQPGPQAALAWYAVAQTLQNRFDLADNNVWECIFLGDFWLYQPKVRSAFKAMAARVGWAGRRPDSIDFYEYALKRATEVGEPRQIAHTALNLWHFAREHAQPAVASVARVALRATFSAHPDVRGILKSEGYALP